MRMSRPIASLATLVFAVMISLAPKLSADTIVLKDGSVEKSNKVWVSDRFVHFVLQGTQGVEIRISKKIVEKVENDDGTIRWQPSGEPQQQTKPQKDRQPVRTGEKKKDDKEQGAVVFFTSKQEKLAFIKANKGQSFYDPRRPKRYWTSVNAKFDTLDQAMASLAGQYHRSVEWIENHMGEENDIAAIHKNLIESLTPKADTQAAVASEKKNKDAVKTEMPRHPHPIDVAGIGMAPGKPTGIRFYDPRRPFKYWSSPTDHYRTLNEALQALARQYHKSPGWIETHMGATNDLDAILQSLQDGMKQDP
jgi:hypothetical protein